MIWWYIYRVWSWYRDHPHMHASRLPYAGAFCLDEWSGHLWWASSTNSPACYMRAPADTDTGCSNVQERVSADTGCPHVRVSELGWTWSPIMITILRPHPIISTVSKNFSNHILSYKIGEAYCTALLICSGFVYWSKHNLKILRWNPINGLLSQVDMSFICFKVTSPNLISQGHQWSEVKISILVNRFFKVFFKVSGLYRHMDGLPKYLVSPNYVYWNNIVHLHMQIYFIYINCVCSIFIQDYPMKEVLCGSYLHEEYKAELINMVLDKLTPETLRWTNKPFFYYSRLYNIITFSFEKLKLWELLFQMCSQSSVISSKYHSCRLLFTTGSPRAFKIDNSQFSVE